MLDSVNFYVREYKLLENKTIILANFLTLNRKKFAIVEAPIERQNYIRIAKDAINFSVWSSSFNIINPENSSTSDNSFNDNKYIPQPRNEAENFQTLKNEIEAYELDSNTEKDPLLYWKNHIQDFPNLSILSSEFLVIPASTTPSERLFSKCKYQIFDRRNRISPENVEALMFLCENNSHYSALKTKLIQIGFSFKNFVFKKKRESKRLKQPLVH
ncbi:zinc finger BED domain-containing 1-like [Brachionus plicatilis]|uniref:Zinc finger BED domain-containing 1-like n=1 Tax=Brachionus plicatilis TaxID=10195 RepID=A0A3M7RRX8_BRAPC|nr:zinc finger BED domain-containing 1-like [Brachionus plicatilis]